MTSKLQLRFKNDDNQHEYKNITLKKALKINFKEDYCIKFYTKDCNCHYAYYGSNVGYCIDNLDYNGQDIFFNGKFSMLNYVKNNAV